MHTFKLFSVHICQLFAQLREMPVTCHPSLRNKQVGFIQLLPLLHCSCHEVCRICHHLEAMGQVAARTARIMEHILVSATVGAGAKCYFLRFCLIEMDGKQNIA